MCTTYTMRPLSWPDSSRVANPCLSGGLLEDLKDELAQTQMPSWTRKTGKFFREFSRIFAREIYVNIWSILVDRPGKSPLSLFWE